MWSILLGMMVGTPLGFLFCSMIVVGGRADEYLEISERTSEAYANAASICCDHYYAADARNSILDFARSLSMGTNDGLVGRVVEG